MTDEEMAKEYTDNLLEGVNCNIGNPGARQINSIDVEEAFLAGLKAGRPKWHKVADGDLPKRVDDYVTNIGILTYDNYGNGVHKWHTPYCEACDYADEVGDDEVIAWCEIPKYTEE